MTTAIIILSVALLSVPMARLSLHVATRFWPPFSHEDKTKFLAEIEWPAPPLPPGTSVERRMLASFGRCDRCGERVPCVPGGEISQEVEHAISGCKGEIRMEAPSVPPLPATAQISPRPSKKPVNESSTWMLNGFPGSTARAADSAESSDELVNRLILLWKKQDGPAAPLEATRVLIVDADTFAASLRPRSTIGILTIKEFVEQALHIDIVPEPSPQLAIDAERDAVYFQTGVISPTVLRRSLKRERAKYDADRAAEAERQRLNPGARPIPGGGVPSAQRPR